MENFIYKKIGMDDDTMYNKAYISLGSNIGDRESFLKEAIQLLQEKAEIRVTNLSSIYETDPVGLKDQPNFLNMVVEVETSLNPEQLLAECLFVENQLGRVRLIRWGPRSVDLDLILFNQEIIHLDHLIVPHPRAHERAFVLMPLAEINPDIKFPTIGKSVSELLENMQNEGVRLWKERIGEDVFGHSES